MSESGSRETRKLVVTRHRGLVDWLRARKLITADDEVWTHVEDSDVAHLRGREVWGVLPLHLAAECASVTVVPVSVPYHLRGEELSADQVELYRTGAPVTYVVQRRR